MGFWARGEFREVRDELCAIGWFDCCKGLGSDQAVHLTHDIESKGGVSAWGQVEPTGIGMQ
jgi:hypothetical protein